MANLIFDAHNHIGHVKDRRRTADDLVHEMDAAGVDRSVVFSVAENIDNQEVAAAAAHYPDRLVPFVVVNPWLDGAEDELRCYLDQGFVGVKLHPVRHGYPLNRRWLVDPIIDICADRKVPVIAYGGQDYFSTPDRFEDLARRYPETDFIIAHMGYVMERDAAARAAKRYPNIYLETSGVTTLRYITGAIESGGPEKLIFGSNTPHSSLSESLEVVRAGVPDPDHQRLVFGGNLDRLLGIVIANEVLP